MEHLVGLAELKSGAMAKRVSTIIIFIVVVLLTSAQTTQFMKEDNQETIPQYSYTEKELEKVSAYIERQYGDYEEVMHEMVSPDIHCDIVLVPPTDSSPYYKLVTMGAGAYKMNIPKELKSTICDRAEYVIFLPKDWNIIGVDNEENWWPMRMLKRAARLTVDTDDYLYITHSVQVEEDGSPVAENTQFNSFVLMPSIGKEGQVVEPLKLSLFGKKVAFYQLFPLYPEELKFKLEHGFDELVELFQEESMVVNTHRKNYCKE